VAAFGAAEIGLLAVGGDAAGGPKELPGTLSLELALGSDSGLILFCGPSGFVFPLGVLAADLGFTLLGSAPEPPSDAAG
jgi:hypothetical protein